MQHIIRLVIVLPVLASLGWGSLAQSQAPRPTAAPTSEMLAGQGSMDFQQGHYAQALDAFRAAEDRLPPGSPLALRAELKYRQGRALHELARYEEAINAYLSALQGQRATDDARSIGATLHALGDAQAATGKTVTARRTYIEALTYRRNGGDAAGEVRTLINLAQSFAATGDYADAVRQLDTASAILPRGDRMPALDRARLANSIGMVQALIGQYDAALQAFQDAARLYEDIDGQEDGLAESIRNEAFVSIERGEFEHARAQFEQSIKVLPVDHVLNRAKGQNGMGYSLVRLGRGDEAVVPLTEAVARLRIGPQPVELSRALESLGSAHVQMQEWATARVEYLESLQIARYLDSPDDEREVLFSLGKMYVMQGEAAAAIFHLKLAVNVSQRLRAGAAALSLDGRKSFARRLSEPYKLLSRLLADQGRLAEAEQVLLALKDAEYVEFVRGNAPGGSDPVALTPEEKRLADEINALADSLGKVYAELDAHRRKVSVLEPDALRQREERRDALQQQLLAKLSEVSARLKPKDGEAATAVTPQDTRLTRLVNKLTNPTYGEANVVVMYVPEERVTTVLVTDLAGPTALQLPVGTSTLNPLINELRLAIREKRSYRAPAQTLYQHLIAPVEAHLRTRKVEPKTLMLYLTGRLRYLPFAALVDDQGSHPHLIEKYRLAVFTAAARDKADVDPISHWSVTAFGSTQPLTSENLPALLAVKDELNGIVRTASNPGGTLPGQSLLDEEFTRAAWQSMLNAQPGAGSARNSVVHVATHFQSVPGDWNRSFLLLGTGEHYEISELDKALSTNLDDVDLLTLSACATELTDEADGKEFEGLGAVFQKKGAKAVIGTLWPVQDEGGAALMKAFYAARGEQRQMSKAAALQDAQVQLLSGKIKSTNPTIDLTHPYYWAPFILMGNWL